MMPWLRAGITLAWAAGLAVWGFAGLPVRGEEDQRDARRESFGVLLRRLEHADLAVRAKAARALGALGDKRAVEPLIAVLKPARDRRQHGLLTAAAEALGELGDRRAAKPLLALLEQPYGARRELARALGKVGGSVARDALMRLAKSEDSQARAWAAEGLGLLGDPGAVHTLVDLLRDRSPTTRFRAAEALRSLGRPAVGPVIAALREERPAVRAAVAEALDLLAARRDVPREMLLPAADRLAAALADWRPPLRFWAATALVKIGPPAVGPLVIALGDEARAPWASKALTKIGGPAVEPLVAALGVEDRRAAGWAARTLAGIGKPAAKPLDEARRSADPRLRAGAVLALARAGPKQAVPALLAAMKDRAAPVRAAAAEAVCLCRLTDERLLEPLLEATRSWPAEQRPWAVHALGCQGSRKAFQTVGGLLDSNTPALRLAAVEALGLAGGEASVDRLVRILEGTPRRGAPAIRVAAAKVLVGTGRAKGLRPVLIRAAEAAGARRAAYLDALVRFGLDERSQADRTLLRKLQREVERLSFSDIDLRNVIQFLREYTDTNIHVRWGALAAGYVRPNTKVSLDLRHIPGAHGLLISLLAAAEPGTVATRIVDGVLVVSTVEELESLGKLGPLRLDEIGPGARELRWKLATRIRRMSFANIELEDALQFLREYSDAEIQADWQAMAKAGVTMRAKASVDVRNVTVNQALWLMLLDTGGTKLRYLVRDGKVVVTAR